ncbi:MAG: RDD family protein [Cyclobacteriaceae bacterium]|nr:RDD family protein [Cyclobacteriaceae bacterium HetDA_MAG_MS6]
MPKFVTSQSVEIDLELGSVGERIVAYLIDLAVIFAYLMVVLFFTASFREPIIISIAFIPILFYSLTLELITGGQSIGKKAMNLKVVRLDGSSPGIGNYLLRWVMRLVDITLFNGVVAVISILSTKYSQRLGDLLAGTIVIKIRQVGQVKSLKSIVKEEHVVTFHEVKLLNDKHIELIKKTLKMRKDGFNSEPADKVADKVKEKLNISSDMPVVKFLYTIIADYEYLAHQEY